MKNSWEHLFTMSTGSYLTGGPETVQVWSCPRSFEQIVADVDKTSPRLISYGLYLGTVREMAKISRCSDKDLNHFFSEPWTLLSDFRKLQRRLDGIPTKGAPIHLGEVVTPRKVLDAVRPLAVNPVIDLVVIQMNVQDLISTKRSSSQATQFDIKSPFEVKISAGEDRYLDTMIVRYHRIRFTIINILDLEIILRAKAAESPVLTLGEVSMLLDPLIPTVTLKSHRTVNAIVDWALVQGNQSSALRSTRTDPSGSWMK